MRKAVIMFLFTIVTLWSSSSMGVLQDQIKEEEKLLKMVRDRVQNYSEKYTSFVNMDFSNLEKKTKAVAKKFRDAVARTKGKLPPEERAKLRLEYLRALHYEYSQKLYTFESAHYLSLSGFTEEFAKLVIGDIVYVVENMDWKQLFKQALECLDSENLEQCKDIMGHLQNVVVEMVASTCKLRFVKDLQSKGIPKAIAEDAWSNMVMPEIKNTPVQDLVNYGLKNANEKLGEKLKDEVKRRVLAEIKKKGSSIVGRSREEIKEYIEKEAKTIAGNIVAPVTFASDLFWKGYQIYVNEKLVYSILPTIQSRLALCRKVAGPGAPESKIVYYYKNNDALKAELLKKKVKVKRIPRRTEDRNAPETKSIVDGIKIEKAEKKAERIAKQSGNEGANVDYGEFKRLLSELREDFRQGTLYYKDYLDGIGRITSAVKEASEPNHNAGNPDKEPIASRLKKEKEIYALAKGMIDEEKKKEEKLRREMLELTSKWLSAQSDFSSRIREIDMKVLKAKREAEDAALIGDTVAFTAAKKKAFQTLAGAHQVYGECEAVKREDFSRMRDIVLSNKAYFYQDGEYVPIYGRSDFPDFVAFLGGSIGTRDLTCLPRGGGLEISLIKNKLDSVENEMKIRIMKAAALEKGKIEDFTSDGYKQRKINRKDVRYLSGTIYRKQIDSNLRELETRHSNLFLFLDYASEKSKTLDRKTREAIKDARNAWIELRALEIEVEGMSISPGKFKRKWLETAKRLKKDIIVANEGLRAMAGLLAVSSSRMVSNFNEEMARYNEMFSLGIASGDELKAKKTAIAKMKKIGQRYDDLVRYIKEENNEWHDKGEGSVWPKAEALARKSGLQPFENREMERRISRFIRKISGQGRGMPFCDITMPYTIVATDIGSDYDTEWVDRIIQAGKTIAKNHGKNIRFFSSVCKKMKDYNRKFENMKANFLPNEWVKLRDSYYLYLDALQTENGISYCLSRDNRVAYGRPTRTTCDRLVYETMKKYENGPSTLRMDLSYDFLYNGKSRSQWKRIIPRDDNLFGVKSDERAGVLFKTKKVSGYLATNLKSVVLRFCELPVVTLYGKAAEEWEMNCERQPSVTLPVKNGGRITYFRRFKPNIAYVMKTKLVLKDGSAVEPNISEPRFYVVAPQKNRGGEADDEEAEENVESGGTTRQQNGENTDKNIGNMGDSKETGNEEKQWDIRCSIYPKNSKAEDGVFHVGDFVTLVAKVSGNEGLTTRWSWSEVGRKSTKHNSIAAIQLRQNREGDIATIRFKRTGVYDIVYIVGDKKYAKNGGYASCKYRVHVLNRRHPHSGDNGKKENDDNAPTASDNIIPPDVSSKYLGCFKDKGDPLGTTGRDLNGAVFNRKDMTVELCSELCSKRGYRYAGVQFSSWCFCGNRYGTFGKANNCNMKCSGNSSEICGGSWANSVYKAKKYVTNVSSHSSSKHIKSYLGCFKDKGDPFGTRGRDLNGKFVSAADMTIQKCLGICASARYPYAGVEYGKQCFCGRSYGKFGRANNCNMHCSGDNSEICGGFWAIGVYSVPLRGVSVRGNAIHSANRARTIQNTNRKDCKSIYREYVEAYNHIIALMNAGKGNTQEANEAYRVYNQKRDAYVKCNKDVTRVEQRGASNRGQQRVIYNSAEGGENFLNNERGNGVSRGASSRVPKNVSSGQLESRAKFHFHDDFNRFNSRHWEAYEWQTLRKLPAALVHNGVLDLRCNRTDRSAFVASKPIRVEKGDVVRIQRRVRAHYANKYFEGGIWFYQTSSPEVRMPANRAAWLSAFGRNLFNVTYFHYFYEKPGVRQYVPAKNGFVIQGKNWKRERNYHVIAPLWDRWFVEEIRYDTASGVATYTINGQTVSVRTIPYSGPYLRFIMHSYGWYTGHDIQVDWVDVSVGSKEKESGMKNQMLVDTADMFTANGHTNNRAGISQQGEHNALSCKAIYQAYVSDYNQLVQEIADQSVSQQHLIKMLHNYRKDFKQYQRCSGAKIENKNSWNPLASESSAQRCGVEYIHYKESYEELSRGLMRMDDWSFLRVRQRFLRDKKAYEECLQHPKRAIQKSASIRKVAPRQKSSLNSHEDIAYMGTPINNVLIALKAISQKEPDESTITNDIPDGKTPFYLFIYYKGAHPSDRLEVLWYLKKAGEKEQLLLDEAGGRFPASEGVVRGGPILVEGGRFPAGEYRLLLKVNGKKAFEKFFRILR